MTALLITAAPAYAGGSDDDGHDDGFTTTAVPYLKTADRPDVTITPLITTGDTLASGYRFESIPDGISINREDGAVDVYVNHETSTVPFPYNPVAPTANNGENDFDNAQLSKLTLDKKTGAVLKGSLAITSSQNYQRFCSNYLATEKEGFEDEILFTNEEAVEWINPTGEAFPAAGQGAPGARQVGVTVAHDIETGQTRTIWGMGRLNHENMVALPGFKQRVLLTGDDTFLNNPAQSQVYSYIAKDSEAVWNDKGDLWAFVSDDPTIKEYGDIPVGSTQSISGHYIKVPRDIATGRLNGTGRDLVAADKGFPKPTAAEFTGDARGIPVDGPQWVLEKWSDANNVFQFVRIEDIAYDKRPGMGNVVYLADSGRGTTGAVANRKSTNGRIWKMVFDKKDPTKVTSLSVFIEGDDNPVKTRGEIHQPDNLETTQNSLLITEDPGGSQQFPIGSTDPNATEARLWRVPLDNPAAAEVVVRVNQAADGTAADVDGRPNGNLGSWESSGVVDASSVYGPGAFLIVVQAHTLWVEKGPGRDLNNDGAPDWTNKREGGQLLLIRIPGA